MRVMTPISQQHFDRLVATTRLPSTVLLILELEWYSALKEQYVGTVVLDRTDKGYSWMLLARDRSGDYRPIESQVSLPDRAAARKELSQAIARAVKEHGSAANGNGLDEAPFEAYNEATFGPITAETGLIQAEIFARALDTQAEWLPTTRLPYAVRLTSRKTTNPRKGVSSDEGG